MHKTPRKRATKQFQDIILIPVSISSSSTRKAFNTHTHTHTCTTLVAPPEVDRHVSAEIPPQSDGAQALLADIVARCMMHGPCGVRNPLAPCILDDGTCKAKYPKEFQDETFLRADGYPLYRRRDDGASLEKGGVLMDNRDVVPYSPVLLKRHDAHLNVEVVSNIRLVKYIFKYTFKGHDRARVELSDTLDEIQEHLDARYLGATEAAWRLFEYPMHGQSHSVQRLVVHLPGQQFVTFQDGSEAEALHQARSQNTTLTAWFQFNATHAALAEGHAAVNGLYQDMPLHCTWQKDSRQWRLRKQGGRRLAVVGRVAPVSPTDGEKYFLYLLLLSSAGATCFTDLRTLDGHVFPTFQAAAVARGLCESDDHLHAALSEVLATAAAAPARSFFAMILSCCDVSDPVRFWQLFADDLSEDLLRQLGRKEAAQDAALADIQVHLCRHGRKTSDFGLPEPQAFDPDCFRLRELRAELAFDQQAEHEAATSMRRSMRPGSRQAGAYDAIAAALALGTGAIYFVDGPGGTGKSFLFQALLHTVRATGQIAAACSWNGLAASLLPGGRTCHARFGFPVPVPREHVPWRVTARTGKGQVLIRARLLLWDEVVTAPGGALDAADACLRDLCQIDQPFGGKIVVLGGDLRQTLPVLEHADRPEIVANSITGSAVWTSGQMQRLTLDANIRASEDSSFRNFLLQIGDGTGPFDADLGARASVLPTNILAPRAWGPLELINFVFEDIVTVTHIALLQPTPCNLDALASRAVLAPKNTDVTALNDALLAKFPATEIVEFHGTTKLSAGTAEDYSAFPPDYLNSLDLPGLPPNALRLCRGALITLLRNIDYEHGLCNGTRCLVVRASARVLDVLVLTGTHQGRRAFLPRIPLSPSEQTLPVKLIRRQFPVRLAWAMTINKAQGQTLASFLPCV